MPGVLLRNAALLFFFPVLFYRIAFGYVYPRLYGVGRKSCRIASNGTFFLSGAGGDPKQILDGGKVAFEYEAGTLCGEGRLDVVVPVVVVVIGFEAEVSVAVKQVFEIEVADEGVVAGGVVAITEVSVEYQPVVEQLTGKGQFKLDVRKIAFVASDLCTDVPFVADLPQQVVELRREGRGGN